MWYYIENREKHAVQEALSTTKLNVSTIARKWEITRDTLKRRLKGSSPRFGRPGIGKILTDEQVNAITLCCEHLDRIRTSTRLSQVQDAANHLLSCNSLAHDSPPSVGIKWAQSFVNRHPQLHKVKQKPLDLLRHTTHGPNTISGNFTKLQDLIMEKNILDADIWNIDETGFRIDVGSRLNN